MQGSKCWHAMLALVAGALTAPAGLHAAAPPPLEAYGDLPAVEQMAMSPGGSGLAVIARIKGARQLLVLDGERKIRAIMPVGEAKIRDLEWTDEGHVCVTLSRTDYIGEAFTKSTMEFSYSAIVPVDGSKPRFVFANLSAMIHAEFGRYGFRTVNGRHLGFFGGVELKPSADRTGFEFDRGEPALFAVDVETMAVQRLAKAAEDGHDRDWLIDGHGAVAAILDISHGSGNWTLMAGNGARLANGSDPGGHVRLVALGRDGNSIVLSKREASDGENHWYEVPLAGGNLSEIVPGIRIRRIYKDPESGRMIGYLPDSGEAAGVPVLTDPALQDKLRKVYRAFPKREIAIEEFTPDIGRVLVHTSGNGDPGSWFQVDLAGRKADPVGDDRPLIAGDQVGTIRTVSYHAADGLEMSGILTLPPGKDPHGLPVVMLPHGGPHAYDKAEFDWWAQALASRGYAVFQPNFRGSTDRDTAFMNAGNGEWGGKMQSDISDGLGELARQGIVDPKRACIVGASYGGYAALAGVTLQHGIYRCAVAVAPVSDLSEMYYTDLSESADDPMLKRTLREMLGKQEGLSAVSPRRHASSADAPVLLIHGKDDTVVPFRQSELMRSALLSAHKPVEMVVLKQEDHWLSRAETRKQMLEACVGFVIAHNPPT